MFGALGLRAASSGCALRRSFTASAAQGYQARLSQFYHNTLRDDLMVLQYVPPAVRARQLELHETQKVEGVSESAPNPLRRHKTKIPRAREPRSTPHNVPFVTKVTVHIRCREALNNKNHLLSALMALQIVTGRRAQLIRAKSDAATWKLRKGMPIAAKVDLEGDDMFEFLDKLVEVVLPRMKEYGGLRMSAGDGNGNFTMGFDDSVIGLFPEMEMVYDMFPLITGFTVNIATTAVRNPPGRLLLSGLGLPFLHARKPESETHML
ncbi:ribosomal protein [Coemansia biformis]|uniref:Ribosomal protein n=1 Tax=Coemansia biformis TaxID=1286918 RepID=A0A9W7YCQ3_9FUNG|nr:ribosomal protein [Coemansia biformis]